MRSAILGAMSACNWLPTNTETGWHPRPDNDLPVFAQKEIRMLEMHHQFSPEKLLLARTEAAHMLSISLGKLENLIRSGQLDVVRIGRRVLVSRDALRRLLGDMESQRHGKK